MKLKFFFTILCLILSSCQVLNQKEPVGDQIPTGSSPKVSPGSIGKETDCAAIWTTLGPTLIFHDRLSSENPIFLLDISTGDQYPLVIPKQVTIPSLNRSLDKTRRYMVLVSRANNDEFGRSLLIFDLFSQSVIHTISLSPSAVLDTELLNARIPDDVMQLMSEQQLGNWMLLEGYDQSLDVFAWSEDSRHLFYINQCQEVFSCLYKYDLQLRTSEQLEDEAYFVKSFSFSPGGNSILIQKSPLPQLVDFNESNAFIINGGKTIQVSKSPLDPGTYLEYGWKSESDLIIKLYDMQNQVYRSLSSLAVETLEVTEVTQAPFSDFAFTENHIILINDGDAISSSVSMLSSDLQEMRTFEVKDNCSQILSSPSSDYSILIVCANNVFGLSIANELTLVSSVSGQLLISPDQEHILLVQSTPGSSDKRLLLFLKNFKLIRDYGQFDIAQIAWLPDSSGFLYFTKSGVFVTTLDGAIDQMLLQNRQDDYFNLDFSWFKTE